MGDHECFFQYAQRETTILVSLAYEPVHYWDDSDSVFNLNDFGPS